MIDLIDRLPPGIILIVGGLLLPLLRGRRQQAALLLLPLLSAGHLLCIVLATDYADQAEFQVTLNAYGYDLMPIHIDRLSLVWGCIFHIAAIVCALFALHVKDNVQHVAAMVYVGAAIAAVFAGDLITLFVYWELTAISSAFLIWASRTERSYRAGMRYLIVQVGSGVILLSGILLHFRDTGSLSFVDAFHTLLPTTDDRYLGLNSPGTLLIFIAFGIKAAFPLLHNWLIDAYPEATATGTVFLSAFTTKLAIYTLARGFPGTEILVWIGAVMAAFPLFYAVIEFDLRRVLAYSLNNQLGYMVVGVGLANFARYPDSAALALNGTAAHAFAHILYKALLFMSMGAVLHRAGTVKSTELGGLYKSMPWTTAFCLVGAASMSAPLFCGFVSKSMILSAAAEQHRMVVWLVLVFATAGVFQQAGIKLPYAAFFGKRSGERVDEAPWNMLTAMGITAALCIMIGVLPGALYSILPYDEVRNPYDLTHVITQLQLLLFAALSFAVLKLCRVYPPEIASVNLDTDWIYRKPLPAIVARLYRAGAALRLRIAGTWLVLRNRGFDWLKRQCSSGGGLGGGWSTSGMVLWAAILLGAYLILYYLPI